METFATVIEFWRNAGAAKWFARDDAFDAEFRARLLDTHYAAARRELEGWMESAEGALALIVLLLEILAWLVSIGASS